MGKVVIHATISLDGYIAGPNDDLRWMSAYAGSVIRFAPCAGILMGWTRSALIWNDYVKDCRTQTASRPHLVRQFPYRPR